MAAGPLPQRCGEVLACSKRWLRDIANGERSKTKSQSVKLQHHSPTPIYLPDSNSLISELLLSPSSLCPLLDASGCGGVHVVAMFRWGAQTKDPLWEARNVFLTSGCQRSAHLRGQLAKQESGCRRVLTQPRFLVLRGGTPRSTGHLPESLNPNDSWLANRPRVPSPPSSTPGPRRCSGSPGLGFRGFDEQGFWKQRFSHDLKNVSPGGEMPGLVIPKQRFSHEPKAPFHDSENPCLQNPC